MTPEQIVVAAELVKKREVLQKVLKDAYSHDHVFKLVSAYKSAGFFDLLYFGHEEMRQVADLMLKQTEALLASMCVELPEENT